MIEKIKMIYQNNRMWLYLLQFILISSLLAVVVILIDSKIIIGLDYIPSFLLTSVELAKLILGTLAGSLLTITTFTFSTIMVVITMYSSQFSPRVVGNFLTNKVTMRVLGLFIGGFFYCIFALFFMRNAFSEYEVLAATIAVIYSGLSIIYFVVFVFNVSSSIQASKLISRLYHESEVVIDRALKYRENQRASDSYAIGDFKCYQDLRSEKEGYLEAVAFNQILDLLEDLEIKLALKVDIGQRIQKQQKLATLYYNDDPITDPLLEKILGYFSITDTKQYTDYRFSRQEGNHYEVSIFEGKYDIRSDRNGYLEFIDFESILDVLKDLEVKMVLRANIGDFVFKSQTLASLYYNQACISPEVEDQVLMQFSIAEERIEYKDYRFSLQKIVDITLRAVSPGINDPNTAIDCINNLGVLLAKLSQIKGSYIIHQDQDSKAEIAFEDFDFKEDLYVTFYQIIHYSKEDISVILALLNAMKIIYQSALAEKRQAVLEFSDYIYDSCINHFHHQLDRDMLARAKQAIAG